MSKEVLFRAKLKDWKTNPEHNRWVEGFYLNRKETTYCLTEDYERTPVKTLHFIAEECMTDWGLPNDFELYEIDPDTLCRYTGYDDKDGNKIWENDELKYDGIYADCIGIVKYGSYFQDGSGGEYSGRECIGFYVEMTKLTPYEWDDDMTLEEVYGIFPDHLRRRSLVEVLKVLN